MPLLSETHGFARADAHLGNWRTRPFSTWAFSHVNELVPVARIATQIVQRGEQNSPDDSLLDELITLSHGPETVGDFLTRSETDVLLVQRHGRTIARWHAPTCDPALPHIVFSVTKSVTGILCGIAQHMGLLDPERTIGDYLSETRAGAYGDCLVRHVLDMRVSLDFQEDYLDTQSDYARYRRAMLWNPTNTVYPTEGLAPLLAGLKKGAAPHGGPFAYQSPNSDVLGLVLERVTGESYADFAARVLWQPMGARDDAFVTVDAFGAPRGAGGLLCTAQDLARLGGLMLDPQTVLPEAWLTETWSGGDRTAWDQGDFRDFIKGGSYTNQWYRFGQTHDALAAIGIHGQYLYVDRRSETVIVKLGSQTLPQDEILDYQNLRFLQQMIGKYS